MGYEPMPHVLLDKYYKYIKDKEDKICRHLGDDKAYAVK